MQAKDITDEQFRAAVINARRPGHDFTNLYAVAKQFPLAPHKVVQAKLDKLIRRWTHYGLRMWVLQPAVADRQLSRGDRCQLSEREAIVELARVVQTIADCLVLALGRPTADDIDNRLDAITYAMSEGSIS